MKPKLKKAMLLGLAITFLLSSTLYAEHYRGEKKGAEHSNKKEISAKLVEELGITPEQEAKLKEQRKEFMGKNKELKKNMRARRKELKRELEKPNIDRVKVEKIIADINNLTGEKLKNRVDKIISMKNILTPEQFKKLRDKTKGKRQAKTWHGKKEYGSRRQ